jgi:hypothetical protein
MPHLPGGYVPAEPEPVAIQGFSAPHLIGRGGFSTVYRAVQERLNRTVAIKVLHVDVSDAPARDRFLNECAAAGKLANHPNIVTVYDSGFTALGEPYLVMEYCDQGSLADRVRNAPLEGGQALSVMVKLAGALATAHAGGILHRPSKSGRSCTYRWPFTKYVHRDLDRFVPRSSRNAAIWANVGSLPLSATATSSSSRRRFARSSAGCSGQPADSPKPASGPPARVASNCSSVSSEEISAQS